MVMKKREITDQRVTSCEISGDGEAWSEFNSSQFTQSNGSFASLLNMLIQGERVFVRVKFVDVYDNGTTGLPKTGPVYEMHLTEMKPMRVITEAAAVKEIDDGAKK